MHRPLLLALLLIPLAGCLAPGDNPHYRAGLDDVLPATKQIVDWPTFTGNNQGWNYHAEADLPACDAPRPDQWRECIAAEWKQYDFNTGNHGAAKSSAVVLDETIYVGSDDGTLHAFLANGTELWNATTEFSKNGIHGTPTAHGDRVYVGAYDGAVYAFDRHTGDRIWHTQVGSWIGSSVRLHDDLLYVAVEHGGSTKIDGQASTRAWGDMQILDAESGERIWRSQRLGSHPHSTVAISTEDNVFVVGCNDDHVYAWDLDDRSLRWDFHAKDPGGDGDVKGPIALYDGAAFFGSWNNKFYRIDLETGEADWSFKTRDWAMTGSAIDPERNLVIFGSHDANIYALNATTGTEQWRVQTGARIVGTPTLTPDILLFGSNDYHVYAIDPDDGNVLWRYPTLHRISAAPLIVGDRILFADRSEAATGGTHGILYALAPPA